MTLQGRLFYNTAMSGTLADMILEQIEDTYSLKEGQSVTYVLETSHRLPQATQVKLARGAQMMYVLMAVLRNSV